MTDAHSVLTSPNRTHVLQAPALTRGAWHPLVLENGGIQIVEKRYGSRLREQLLDEKRVECSESEAHRLPDDRNKSYSVCRQKTYGAANAASQSVPDPCAHARDVGLDLRVRSVVDAAQPGPKRFALGRRAHLEESVHVDLTARECGFKVGKIENFDKSAHTRVRGAGSISQLRKSSFDSINTASSTRVPDIAEQSFISSRRALKRASDSNALPIAECANCGARPNRVVRLESTK